MENIEQRVRKIIAEQLGVNETEIKNESSFVDDLGADSLDTVELVMALEEEFETDGFYQSRRARLYAWAIGRCLRARLCHQHSAVHMQRCAGDVTGARPGKKQHRIRDVLRRTETSERNARNERVALRLRQRLRHFGVDEPGCDAIDGDVAAADFERERFRESDQRGLRCGVIGLTGIARTADD